MDADLAAIIRLQKRASLLKAFPPTGRLWQDARLDASDSVAAHTYGVALLSYLAAKSLKAHPDFEPINTGRALTMAVLHDLPEGILAELLGGFGGLIEVRGQRHPILEQERQLLIDEQEAQALTFMLRDVDPGGEMRALIVEYEECSSMEAKIVRFADVLDAFAPGKARLDSGFAAYLAHAEAMLRRGSPDYDNGVGSHLAEWLSQARYHWDVIGDGTPEGSVDGALSGDLGRLVDLELLVYEENWGEDGSPTADEEEVQRSEKTLSAWQVFSTFQLRQMITLIPSGEKLRDVALFLTSRRDRDGRRRESAALRLRLRNGRDSVLLDVSDRLFSSVRWNGELPTTAFSSTPEGLRDSFHGWIARKSRTQLWLDEQARGG